MLKLQSINYCTESFQLSDGEFSLEWCIDLCYEVCKEWADWRALIAQERYCSLDAPPPGERFEDEKDAEADLSDDTGDITSVIAECEEIQETPEADDLVTADTCVKECDGHGVSYWRGTSRLSGRKR